MSKSGASGNGLEVLFADLLEQQAQSTKQPPVHLWNPDKSGDMDLRIDREGQWIHEGDPIRRPALVKLFASILKREGDNYFLVTPVEKWQINVDVAPFFMVSAEKLYRSGEQAIQLRSISGDHLLIGPNNPLWVDYDEANNQPVPLVTVRDNLNGLLSRSLYYQLVDWAHMESNDDGSQTLRLRSMGVDYLLGHLTSE
ncbi:MAG: DUF1285 domain-containing protein [Porticoccaceae bacterium]|nr:DUF1285 domain-containing protein [Porticoccaceae bacterium]